MLQDKAFPTQGLQITYLSKEKQVVHSRSTCCFSRNNGRRPTPRAVSTRLRGWPEPGQESPERWTFLAPTPQLSSPHWRLRLWNHTCEYRPFHNILKNRTPKARFPVAVWQVHKDRYLAERNTGRGPRLLTPPRHVCCPRSVFSPREHAARGG